MPKNKKEQFDKGEIIIYQSAKGAIEFKGDFSTKTIWGNLNQIADLFGVQKAAISKHLKNIYYEKELNKKSTVSILETVQTEGKRQIKRSIEYYNLDAIISVGYRVNSQKATKFRIWSTSVLKKYLLKGYVINQKRLAESENKFKELQETINFLSEKAKKKNLAGQGAEILSLLKSYSKTLTLLEKYDKNDIVSVKSKKEQKKLEYADCLNVIQTIKQELIKKKEAGDIFGNIRDDAFEGIIRGIYQTFGGRDLYPDMNVKSAHILYLTIKDHPFTDGNKRIASFLFVYFMDLNNYLYRESGEKKINDNALVALALLVAESKPKEKDIMIKLITNLIS